LIYYSLGSLATYYVLLTTPMFEQLSKNPPPAPANSPAPAMPASKVPPPTEAAKAAPSVEKTVPVEPEIFVMPRGALAPKVQKPPVKIKLGRGSYFIIGGIVFLAILGGAGYWLTQSSTYKVVSPVTVVPTPPPPAEETPPEVATTTPEAPVVPPLVRSGADSDSDGLTDIEEEMYKSNLYNPDTDGDKFLDGNEVFHLYSPIGRTPASLLDSGLVSTYQNQKWGYLLWYPISWQAIVKDEDSREVNFIAPSNETVTIVISPNPEGLSLEDWYLKTEPNAKTEEIKPITAKSGKGGILSEDRLTAYFLKDSEIIKIKYELENRTMIEYRTTFGMMARSLVY